MHVGALLGGSCTFCQGRDIELSIRSYRAKHRSLFRRQKRLCVPFFPPPFAHTLTPLSFPSRGAFRIALWRTYPPNTNYGLLSSLHKAPILDLHWSLYSPTLYTVSADHVLCLTDVTTGQRIKKVRAHRGIINALDRTMAGGAGVELVVTGSDDGSVKVWEGGEGAKQCVAMWEVGCPVTGVCWSADGQHVYVGALDNEIHVRVFFFPSSPLQGWDAETVPWADRCTTCGKTKRCMRSRDIPTHRRRSRSPPTGPTSSRPRSPRKLSSTTSVPFRPPPPGSTGSSKAHPPGLKTRC